MFLILTVSLSACDTTSIQESAIVAPVTAPAQRFADGVKGIKILTDTTTTGSYYPAPAATPVSTLIPATFPGYDGVTTYTAGISPTTYFALDGVTATSQPSWLLDFQIGTTSTSSTACAAFGGVTALDVSQVFRVSEADCSAAADGTGGKDDPVFIRAVLNRDPTVIGSAENLMIQIEYQASGLRANLDSDVVDKALDHNPEDFVDQLWKIFWNTTLSGTSAPVPFATFVPPNYASCLPNGSGNDLSVLDGCHVAGYKGSPIKVKQFIIPISAYPNMSVIQISRVKGRVDDTYDSLLGVPNGSAYVNSFCGTGSSPLCLGVVIHSITLMRI